MCKQEIWYDLRKWKFLKLHMQLVQKEVPQKILKYSFGLTFGIPDSFLQDSIHPHSVFIVLTSLQQTTNPSDVRGFKGYNLGYFLVSLSCDQIESPSLVEQELCLNDQTLIDTSGQFLSEN